ncbi:MAG: flagellar motor switch protein FliM [Syntrophomonadaceae bacterium]|nr:flagellar motor switch protein FliM [Syntrophomonadaceae bacterium]
MNEVLSQSEIDNLISAIAKGQGELPLQDQEELQFAAKKYNFRKPNKFTKDQLRTLYMINDNLSRILSNYLSGYLRSRVNINIASVEQSTYEEFLLSMISPILITIFQMPPLTGSAVMEFGSNFTMPIIDLLFGGTGKKNNQIRDLTEIELRVLRIIIQKILENMSLAWLDVFQFETVISSMETNPQFSQIISPNETVAIITFTTEVSENQSNIYLCFPWETLKEVIPNLTAQNWFATQKYQEDSTKDIVNNLEKVSLNLSACCGQTDLTIKEILQLEEGDVIILDSIVGDDMELLVEGSPHYKIQPGVIGNKLAAMIAGKI